MCGGYYMPPVPIELIRRVVVQPTVVPLFTAEEVEALTPLVNWDERVAHRLVVFEGWARNE